MEKKFKYYFSLGFFILSLIAYFKEPRSFDEVMAKIFDFETTIKSDTILKEATVWDEVDIQIDTTKLSEIDSLKSVIEWQKKQLQKRPKVIVVKQTLTPNFSKEQQEITTIFKQARDKLGIKPIKKDTIKIKNATTKLKP